MSVFRFGAPTTSSTPFPKRIYRGGRSHNESSNESSGPTFAFSTNPSLLQDITLDKIDMGFRSPAVTGLTMKEYEEELRKLTAENFNLKLRIYFLEERLSKVNGIGDKEELTNIELKVQCESQAKELKKKQELLFEASKAFEKLQKEHKAQTDKIIEDNEQECSKLEAKICGLEAELKALEVRISRDSMDDNLVHAECYKQMYVMEQQLHDYEDRVLELEADMHDRQETFTAKLDALESELEQRTSRITDLVQEVERKEQNLASANYRIRKLEDMLSLKDKEEHSRRERLEEKDTMIDSLRASVSARDVSLAEAEGKLAKERANVQSMQTSLDSMVFQNSRLREEVEMLQTRLKRSSDLHSPRTRGRSSDEESQNRMRTQELERMLAKKETEHVERIQELEAKLAELELGDYAQLQAEYGKACSALKKFVKEAGQNKKDKEMLNEKLREKDAEVLRLRRRVEALEGVSTMQKASDVEPETAADNKNTLAYSPEVDAYCTDMKKQLQTILTDLEQKETLIEKYEQKIRTCNCGVEEKVERIAALEGEVLVLKTLLDERNNEDMDSMKDHLEAELETKKSEIKKLNGELKKRTYNLQELVNTELWDKNRQIERLEKRLNVMSVTNESLSQQVRKLQVTGDGDGTEDAANVKRSLQLSCEERRLISDQVDAMNTVPALQNECARLKAELERSETFRLEAAKVCGLLTSRLEELAGFLDTLLSNGDLLTGIGMKRRQDMKRAVDMSRQLSRNLSLSFGRTLDESRWSECMEESRVGNSTDKVISEQSVMISRLREQLQVLNEGIRQRDIELSHCHKEGPQKERTSARRSQSTHDWLSLSTSALDEESKVSLKPESKVLAEARARSREASESEAWSEPDRSVSQARMGHLDSGLACRGAKPAVSSESSEETLSEMPKVPVKRSRSSEPELKKLQSKIRILEEVNETLLAEVRARRSNQDQSVLQGSDSNLVLSLQADVAKLEDTMSTCRQLELELSAALHKATVSTTQLKKAEDRVRDLERQVADLRTELSSTRRMCEAKETEIRELENKIEESNLENELKLIEAVKQKDVAESRALSFEVKLKETEDLGREMGLRVGEIEKKIEETRTNKEVTVQHVKEAVRHVSTAEKLMAEAERMKTEVRVKEKDMQMFLDLMRKEVEEKTKEAERKLRKTEREKEELRRRLNEEEKNKTEVETRVKDGKERIQCMEEKLRELEDAMDQCNADAQRRIKDVQKRADLHVAEIERKLQERETAMEEEVLRMQSIHGTLRKQLDDADNTLLQARRAAEAALVKAKEEFEVQEAELKNALAQYEADRGACTELTRQLDEVRLVASRSELELSKVSNEKLRLQEDVKRLAEKGNDHRQKELKYTASILKLEAQLEELMTSKSGLSVRLEEIEATNLELQHRLLSLQGADTVMPDGGSDSEFILKPHSVASTLLTDVQLCYQEINGNRYLRQASDTGEAFLWAVQGDGATLTRRNSNSSPDLGIESDQGRFSSLEGQQQKPVAHEVDGNLDRKHLELENADLRRRLQKTRQLLEDTLTQLSAANRRKKEVEKAICKQLHKTHHILKKTRVNMETHDPDTVE